MRGMEVYSMCALTPILSFYCCLCRACLYGLNVPVLATRCRITEAISLKSTQVTCIQRYICM